MSNSYPTTKPSVTIILLCMVCTIAQGKREIPLPTVIPSTTEKCLSADNRQDSLNLIRNATYETIMIISGSQRPQRGPGN